MFGGSGRQNVCFRVTHAYLTNPVLYSGIGLGVGVVASVILFRSMFAHSESNSPLANLFLAGRGWPVALSTGVPYV